VSVGDADLHGAHASATQAAVSGRFARQHLCKSMEIRSGYPSSRDRIGASLADTVTGRKAEWK
jgi:hypothetical protein